MITCDNITVGGSNHLMCEDYSISGVHPAVVDVPYLIVCDGCSSSDLTEYGSKILARLAQIHFWDHFPWEHECRPNPEDLEIFADGILVKSQVALGALSLPDTALDSTLMMAWPTAYGAFATLIYGDGYVFWKPKGGELSYVKIDFTHNAPCYLSYQLDEQRRAVYEEKSQGHLMTITEVFTMTKGATMSSFWTEKLTGKERIFNDSFHIDKMEFFGIASDGIAQIRSKSTGETLPVIRVLEDFTAFKGLEGEFLRRRVKRQLQDYAKDKFFPTDDLSVAVLLNKED